MSTVAAVSPDSAPFADIAVLPLRLHEDARGFFCETLRLSWLQGMPQAASGFVQSNVSLSRKNVLRGLHFQRHPPQGKLVQVLRGEVFDVVVDVRADSPWFGLWKGFTLTARPPQALWIPPGYAHGFVALSDETLVSYQCTCYYDAASEVCLRWDDPGLAITWPVRHPVLSPRDARGWTLAQLRQMAWCL